MIPVCASLPAAWVGVLQRGENFRPPTGILLAQLLQFKTTERQGKTHSWRAFLPSSPKNVRVAQQNRVFHTRGGGVVVGAGQEPIGFNRLSWRRFYGEIEISVFWLEMRT